MKKLKNPVKPLGVQKGFIKFNYFFYDFVKATAAIPGVICLRPKWIFENEEAKKKIKGGAVVMSNHLGYGDPVYIQMTLWYRRHHIICTKEFFETAWPGYFFKYFLCIPIDRDNFGIDTFRSIVDHLKNEEIVSIFPEGHINQNDDGKLNAFKTGMVYMAYQSKKPIVPVYIKKKDKVFSPTVMVIGEAVDVASQCEGHSIMAKMDEIAKQLYEKELQLEKLANAEEI